MVETLANVKGIGAKTINELGSFIVLEGDTTLKRE
jgi:DNA uptake protein ComE-like DNA-binding protein